MGKVYILGYALVRFVGEHQAPLIGNEVKEQVKLKKGDMFITTKANAVALCGGTNYEWVKEVNELTEFLKLNNADTQKHKCNVVVANSEAELYAILEEVKEPTTIVLNYENNGGGLVLDKELMHLVEYINLYEEKIDINAQKEKNGDSINEKSPDEVAKGDDDGVSGDGVADDTVKSEDDKTEDAAAAENTQEENTQEEKGKAKVWTKANILEATDDELKALCKKHKIKYGKLKRNDMVAVLLPFLPEE